MKSIITISVALFMSITFCNAQTQATTNDGKLVLLNEDGSWAYEEKIETKIEPTACDAYISTDVDKVTGKKSTAIKKSIIVSKNGGKKGFGFFLMNSKKSLIMSIKAVGAGGCIDDDAKMNVLFTDGSRLELINNGKFNCKSKFTLYFGGGFGQEKILENFKNKEVEIIRIWTTKSFVEETFTKQQREDLKNTINCLVNAQ
jgi:hypothetical protein